MDLSLNGKTPKMGDFSLFPLKSTPVSCLRVDSYLGWLLSMASRDEGPLFSHLREVVPGNFRPLCLSGMDDQLA